MCSFPLDTTNITLITYHDKDFLLKLLNSADRTANHHLRLFSLSSLAFHNVTAELNKDLLGTV